MFDSKHDKDLVSFGEVLSISYQTACHSDSFLLLIEPCCAANSRQIDPERTRVVDRTTSNSIAWWLSLVSPQYLPYWKQASWSCSSADSSSILTSSKFCVYIVTCVHLMKASAYSTNHLTLCCQLQQRQLYRGTTFGQNIVLHGTLSSDFNRRR